MTGRCDECAGRFEAAIVAAEIAGVMIGYAVASPLLEDKAVLPDDLIQQLRVVNDVIAMVECAVFLAQRIERMRVGRHDAAETALLQELDVRLRQCLEHALVSDAA